ncbi:MAG: SOS response-associated peptidase, partial [Luteimonas sp.]|nr:SOS response-associated peptidase [Luteimonas sp.]
MCSNYRPTTGRDLIHFGVEPPDDLIVGRDVYPGDVGPMLFRSDDAPELSCVAGTFGLLPVWAKERSFARRTYNARSETVAEKPSFRNAWRHQQRCIVPARAIYEPNYDSGKA